MWFVVVALAVIAVVGCTQLGTYETRYDFTTDDPTLERLTNNAAQYWTDLGVIKAAYITVNRPLRPREQAAKRMVIRRVPRTELHVICGQPESYQGDACTALVQRNWEGMYIADDVVDPVRLQAILTHELGHMLAESKDHVEGGKAVMDYNCTALVPNELDKQYMIDHGCDMA